MVPAARVELARPNSRQISSLLCLPVPPRGHRLSDFSTCLDQSYSRPCLQGQRWKTSQGRCSGNRRSQDRVPADSPLSAVKSRYMRRRPTTAMTRSLIWSRVSKFRTLCLPENSRTYRSRCLGDILWKVPP